MTLFVVIARPAAQPARPLALAGAIAVDALVYGAATMAFNCPDIFATRDLVLKIRGSEAYNKKGGGSQRSGLHDVGAGDPIPGAGVTSIDDQPRRLRDLPPVDHVMIRGDQDRVVGAKIVFR